MSPVRKHICASKVDIYAYTEMGIYTEPPTRIKSLPTGVNLLDLYGQIKYSAGYGVVPLFSFSPMAKR